MENGRDDDMVAAEAGTGKAASLTRRDFVGFGAVTAGVSAITACVGGALGARIAGGSGTEAEPESATAPVQAAESGDAEEPWEETPPPAVRPVIVVSGTSYEMGVQYGQQAAAYIKRGALIVKQRALPLWGSMEAISKRMDEFEAIMAEKTPHVVEMWKGIADGAGIDYDDVRMVNLNLPLLIMPMKDGDDADAKDTETCSHFSCWGDATADGRMIVGRNEDQGWNTGAYSVVLVAYPSEGASFIVAPPWAGVVGGSFSINEHGLVLLGSGGMDARPEDSAFGVDAMSAKLEILMGCKTAQEAVDRYLEYECGSAENAQFVDESEAIVVEYTPAVHVVRHSGDFGEDDYLIATNYFIAPEMEPANQPDEWMGGLWDSVPRYETYEQIIRENYGQIDEEVVKSMVGCSTRYYHDGEWHDDTLDLMPFEDPKTLWSPEGRDVMYKTLASACIVPEDRAFSFLQGQTDDLFSVIPHATGTYCKLVLDEVSGMARSASFEAEMRIWELAAAISQGEKTADDAVELLDEAREKLWAGFNYQAEAELATEQTDADEFWGKALTRYCEAQCIAAKGI